MWGGKYRDAVETIKNYARLSYERELTIADSGNISVRLGDEILITAGGSSLRALRDEDLVLIGRDEQILSAAPGAKPSKEASMHAAVYRLMPEAGCVFHMHPIHVTAFAVKGLDVPMLTSTAKRKLAPILSVGYADPGSRELCEKVSAVLAQAPSACRMLLLERHGSLCFGETIEQCYNLTELFEATARIAIISRSL